MHSCDQDHPTTTHLKTEWTRRVEVMNITGCDTAGGRQTSAVALRLTGATHVRAQVLGGKPRSGMGA